MPPWWTNVSVDEKEKVKISRKDGGKKTWMKSLWFNTLLLNSIFGDTEVSYHGKISEGIDEVLAEFENIAEKCVPFDSNGPGDTRTCENLEISCVLWEWVKFWISKLNILYFTIFIIDNDTTLRFESNYCSRQPWKLGGSNTAGLVWSWKLSGSQSYPSKVRIFGNVPK